MHKPLNGQIVLSGCRAWKTIHTVVVLTRRVVMLVSAEVGEVCATPAPSNIAPDQTFGLAVPILFVNSPI
jgi:hypothetical protein